MSYHTLPRSLFCLANVLLAFLSVPLLLIKFKWPKVKEAHKEEKHKENSQLLQEQLGSRVAPSLNTQKEMPVRR